MEKRQGNYRRTHGMSSTSEYKTWKTMRDRCRCKTNHKYPIYGGRGIRVCERWDKFENFIEDMGRRPSNQHSIDRIDNNGNYEPANCRWATRKEQSNNLRKNVYLTVAGERLTVAQAARKLGIPVPTLWTRIYKGWPEEKVISKERFQSGLLANRQT